MKCLTASKLSSCKRTKEMKSKYVTLMLDKCHCVSRYFRNRSAFRYRSRTSNDPANKNTSPLTEESNIGVSDPLPNLPSFIRRVCSSFAPDRGVLRTQLG